MSTLSRIAKICTAPKREAYARAASCLRKMGSDATDVQKHQTIVENIADLSAVEQGAVLSALENLSALTDAEASTPTKA